MPNFVCLQIDPWWTKSTFKIQNVTWNICRVYIYENLNLKLEPNFEILMKWAKFWKKLAMVVIFKYLFIRFLSVQFEIIKSSVAKCQPQNFQKIDQNSWFWQDVLSLLRVKFVVNFPPKMFEIHVIVFDAIELPSEKYLL